MPDFSDFLAIQSKTAWGRTLADFAAFCAPAPSSSTLDVGCGPGLLPAIFAGNGCRSVGIDLDLGLLQGKLGPALVQADALALPFPAGCFDLLTATNVLFLLEDPPAALRAWTALLKAGGFLCLLNPSERLSLSAAQQLADQRGLEGTARDSLLDWARNAESHVRWSEAETVELLRKAGLRMVESLLKVGPGFARLARAVKTP